MDEKKRDWCLHKDTQEWFEKVGEGGYWLTIYQSAGCSSKNSEDPFIWSFLIKPESIDKELKEYTFDQSDGYPATDKFEDEKGVSYYSRFGRDDREPLFFRRSFTGRDGYLEISQEFVHFFQLYYDRPHEKFILIHPDGSEEDVIEIEENKKIRVSLRRLKQYLAFKNMVLVYGVVISHFFNEAIGGGVEPTIRLPLLVKVADNIHYALWYQDSCGLAGYALFSELIGKKIITPMPIEKTGIYPFEPERQYEKFIIEVDSDGNLIEYTCNPDNLSNYFGKNNGNPHYLTPVFFRKEVLNKYYANPAIYSIKDGSIQIGSYTLRADTNHPEYVNVFLGDLGRDIPFTEQQYWKSFNVPPSGKMSNTAIRRSFLGEWAEPESEQFIFKREYLNLQERWSAIYGWPLFKPVNQGDEYRIETLRIPILENQQEFDQQVASLAIILIDSINKKEIDKNLKIDGGELRSIQSLEKFCQSNSFGDYERFIQFLHDLYRLRSQGASHRKSSKEYPKVMADWGIDKNGYIHTFREILKTAIELLHFFIQILNEQA